MPVHRALFGNSRRNQVIHHPETVPVGSEMLVLALSSGKPLFECEHPIFRDPMNRVMMQVCDASVWEVYCDYPRIGNLGLHVHPVNVKACQCFYFKLPEWRWVGIRPSCFSGVVTRTLPNHFQVLVSLLEVVKRLYHPFQGL